MSYLDSILRRGEQVLEVAKLHWIQFVSPMLALAASAVLFAIYAGTSARFFFWFAVLVLLIGLMRLEGHPSKGLTQLFQTI